MSFSIEQVYIIDESPEEALGKGEQKREASIASGDERGRALGLTKGAEALALMGRPDEAAGYASEAVAICTEMKFDQGKAAALNALTIALLKKGGDAEDLEEALDTGMDALKMARKAVFSKGEAVGLLTLSKVYTAMGNAVQGVKYAKDAVALFAEIGEAKSMAAAYKAMSSAYAAKSDMSRAVKSLGKALAIYEEGGDKAATAACMHDIAKAEATGGDYKKASEAVVKAKALYAEAGDNYGQAAVLETLMGFYLEADMYFEAVKVGQERVSLFHEAGDMTSEGFALLKLGQVQLQNEDHEKAEKMAELALSMLAGMGNLDGMKQAKDLLDDAKHEGTREKLGVALHSLRDHIHIPSTLIVDPGLNSRVMESFNSAIRV